MYDYISQANLIIQGCVAVIIVGMFYDIWSSTKVYGGIVGKAIRLFGLGMLFITISIIENLLVTFLIVQNSPELALAQEIMNLAGLVFLGLGFSKLASANKA